MGHLKLGILSTVPRYYLRDMTVYIINSLYYICEDSGTLYKTRNSYKEVTLKSLNNSSQNINEFLNEV